MIPFLEFLVLLTGGLGLAFLLLSWRCRAFPVAAYAVGGAAWGVACGLACWWGLLAANAARSVVVAVAWFPLMSLGFGVVGALAALLFFVAAKGGAILWARRR